MNGSKRRRGTAIFVAVAAALFAGKLAVETWWPVNMQFEARRFPPGFRTLVLNGGASKPGIASIALVGIEPTKAITEKATTPGICDALFHEAADPAIGPPDAAVTVVEFFDYQCPYCRVVSGFLGEIQATDPQVRLVYKEWPILGKNSELAARAALAAEKQQVYLLFHEGLMSTRAIPNEAVIRHIAARSGQDAETIFRDAGSTSISNVITRTDGLARQLGFVGTPSFVVGRTILEGAISRRQLEALIDLEKQTDMASICRDNP